MSKKKVVLPEKRYNPRQGQLDDRRFGPLGPHLNNFSMKTHAGGTTARVHPYSNNSSTRAGPRPVINASEESSSKVATPQKKTSLLGQYKGEVPKCQQQPSNQWYNDSEAQNRVYSSGSDDYTADYDLEESSIPCDEDNDSQSCYVKSNFKNFNGGNPAHPQRQAPLLKTPLLPINSYEDSQKDFISRKSSKHTYTSCHRVVEQQEEREAKCCGRESKHHCKQNKPVGKSCNAKHTCKYVKASNQTIVRKIVTIPQIGMHGGMLVPPNAILSHPGIIQGSVYPNQKLYINRPLVNATQLKKTRECQIHQTENNDDDDEDDAQSVDNRERGCCADDSDDDDTECDCKSDRLDSEQSKKSADMGSSKQGKTGKCDCENLQGGVAMPPVGVMLTTAPVLQTQWSHQGQSVWNFIPAATATTSVPIVPGEKVRILMFNCIGVCRGF